MTLEPDTMTLVPNQPKTPMYSFRLPVALREAFKREAQRRGESMTGALRRFIEGYVRGEK
jgi:hypothetical protein